MEYEIGGFILCGELEQHETSMTDLLLKIDELQSAIVETCREHGYRVAKIGILGGHLGEDEDEEEEEEEEESE